MDVSEQVYETLLNVLEPEWNVPWVNPIFLPGNPCYDAYCGMLYQKMQNEENPGA